MGDPAQPSQNRSEIRLESWKEIAAYLKRDVTTVQRWEKREGMPVHRHVHDTRGSVYALPAELDNWLRSRRARSGKEKGVDDGPFVDEEERADGTAPRKLHWFTIGALSVLAGIGLAYMMSRGRVDNASRPKITSIAVLPLKNMSPDPAEEYFADGMTDALIGQLSGIHNLRVISRTSVMRFKNPQLSAPEIAKTLGVDAIVEGSVMRDGDRVRVTAQLIRGATDEHFWSETYDRELQDVLGLQSELAQSIAEKVEVTVTGEEHQRLSASRRVAPEVYESYLQGSFELNTSESKALIESSIRHFQDAITTDQTFAPAYVGLASAYEELASNFFGEPPDAVRQREMSAARKALELDPTLVDAHLLLAGLEQERWEWTDSETEYRRALELNANNADAHAAFASWLLCQGRVDEALAEAQRGRDIDPLAVEGTDLATLFFTARHYDEAEHELRAVLAARPDDAVALWDLGIVLVDRNQPNDAIPILEKSVSVSNRSPGVIGALARAYGRAGRRGDAMRLVSELQKRRKAGFVPAGAFVNAYMGLGDYDQALSWLEQAYQEHSNSLQYLKVAPEYDPLRGEPRFAELLRRVGLG